MPRRDIPVAVPDSLKWCHSCASLELIQRFDVDRSRPDGRTYACRRCLTAKRKRARHNRILLNETFGRLYH